MARTDAAIQTAGTLAPSSLEIAELVDSRHDSVKRTIVTLAEKGVIAFPLSVEKATAGRPAIEYVFSGTQGKRDSLIVVAQLCPEFTAKIVDRWQELEEKAAAPKHLIPQTLPEALRLAADLSPATGRIRPKSRDEALTVLRWLLSDKDNADDYVDDILLNLIG